jgi:outer membrane lipoprotein SlyB
MSSTIPAKSVQIVAGVAVVMALLGGAYAVGRSQGVSAPEPAPVQAAQAEPEAPAPVAAPVRAEPAPQRLASAQPVRESTRPAPVVEREAQPALCSGCARVTDVHTETRRGQASGVGAVGGAVVGGLLGNMVGGGTGRKLATVGGAVAGGYAGNEIEKNQKTHTVWVIQMRESDGRLRRFERSADPGLRVGDEVRLTENGFTRL